jgi:hypothetical protein
MLVSSDIGENDIIKMEVWLNEVSENQDFVDFGDCSPVGGRDFRSKGGGE